MSKAARAMHLIFKKDAETLEYSQNAWNKRYTWSLGGRQTVEYEKNNFSNAIYIFLF